MYHQPLKYLSTHTYTSVYKLLFISFHFRTYRIIISLLLVSFSLYTLFPLCLLSQLHNRYHLCLTCVISFVTLLDSFVCILLCLLVVWYNYL